MSTPVPATSRPERRLAWAVAAAVLVLTGWLAGRTAPAPADRSAGTATLERGAVAAGPAVAATPDGSASVVWTGGPGGTAVRAAARGPAAPFGPPGPPETVPGPVTALAAAAPRPGTVAVAWRWRRDRRGRLGVSVRRDGRIASVPDLAAGADVVDGPRLAVTPRAGTLAAWVERDGDRWAVRTADLAAPPGGRPAAAAAATGTGPTPRLGGAGAADGLAVLATTRAGRVSVLLGAGGTWRARALGPGGRPALAVDRTGAVALAAPVDGARVLLAGGLPGRLRPLVVAARRGRRMSGAPLVTVDAAGTGTAAWLERPAGGGAAALRVVELRGGAAVLDRDATTFPGATELRSAGVDPQGVVSVLARTPGGLVLARRDPLRRDGRLDPVPAWRTTAVAASGGARRAAAAPLAGGGQVIAWDAAGRVRVQVLEGPLPDR